MKVNCYAEHAASMGGGTVHTVKFLEYLTPYYDVNLILPPNTKIHGKGWYKKNMNLDVSKINIELYKNGDENNCDIFISAWHSKCISSRVKQKYNMVWFPQVMQNTNGFINVSNSEYTKEAIKKRWKTDSVAIYPPTTLFKQSKKKKNIILHVSRLDIPNEASDKGHIELINSFKKLKLKGWKFVIAGTTILGSAAEIRSKKYLKQLKELAKDSNIEFVVNASHKMIEQLFSDAKVYWHCSGIHTESAGAAEHFGLTIIEAMSTGCVPMSFNKGGPREIITKESGFLFNDEKELVKYTKLFTSDSTMMKRMSAATIKRSKFFSEEKSRDNWVSLVTGVKDVTIVIGSHNNLKYLKPCIESLHKNTPEGFELLVVNNGSNKEVTNYLETNKYKTNFINTTKNLSYAKFNNLALKHVKTPYVLYLNDDTVITDKKWLPSMINVIRTKELAGVVGIRCLFPNGKLQHDGVYWNRELQDFKHLDHHKNPSERMKTEEVLNVTGACMLVRKDIAQFSEEYEMGYYEDNDLQLRARKNGYKVYIVRNSTIIHHEGVSMSKSTKAASTAKKNNKEKLIAKWGKEIPEFEKTIAKSKDNVFILNIQKMDKKQIQKVLKEKYDNMLEREKLIVLAFDFDHLNMKYLQSKEKKYINMIYESKIGLTEISLKQLVLDAGFVGVYRNTENTSERNQHILKIVAER